MANSADPGQTAPLGAVLSGSTLFAQVLSAPVVRLNTVFIPFFLLPVWQIPSEEITIFSELSGICYIFFSAPADKHHTKTTKLKYQKFPTSVF